MTRPPLSRSSVASSCASTCGRRRATGVTAVPSRTRDVTAAIALSVTHGSAAGASHTNARWSQMNTPSQPAASAASAILSPTVGSE